MSKKLRLILSCQWSFCLSDVKKYALSLSECWSVQRLMSRLTFDLLCFSLCKMQRRRKSSILPQVFCASGQIILAFSLKNAISSLIICPFGNYLSQFLFSFVISCLGFCLPFWILFSQSLRLCLLYSFTEIIFMSS